MAKLWRVFVIGSVMFSACSSGVKQTKCGDAEVARKEEPAKTEAMTAEPERPGAVLSCEDDTTDYLHASLQMYTVSVGDAAADTVIHYLTGRKIAVGSHRGRKLYLELGEFCDETVYHGGKIYWGDSLIYATEAEVANDWQTCRVCHVSGADITYVLVMMNDRPNPNYWHIVRMDDSSIRLTDNVLAGNDYIKGGRYFHDNVICGDLDGDGIMEVGGKEWTEYWADSMMYHPCYIYKLGTELVLDEVLSERETRAAYDSLFIGLDDGVPVYNPNTAQHENDARKHLQPDAKVFRE